MPPNEILARGVQINSALYLAGCFVAGLVTGNGWAWRFALAAAGVTYLSYLAQWEDARREATSFATSLWTISRGLVLLSIALGAAAGLRLLVP